MLEKSFVEFYLNNAVLVLLRSNKEVGPESKSGFSIPVDCFRQVGRMFWRLGDSQKVLGQSIALE